MRRPPPHLPGRRGAGSGQRREPRGNAPQAGPGVLNRYWSGSTGTHWITPGRVSGDYDFEFSDPFEIVGGTVIDGSGIRIAAASDSTASTFAGPHRSYLAR